MARNVTAREIRRDEMLQAHVTGFKSAVMKRPTFAIPGAWVVSFVVAVSVRASCVGSDQTSPHYDPNYYSVATELRRAQYVIRAMVVRETWLGEDGKPKALEPHFQFGNPRPWGFDPYMGAWYDVDVRESLKGKPPRRLRLFSENSTARFWLIVGDELLIFVSTQDFDAPVGNAMTMDICGNSRVVTKAGDVLAELEKLTRTTRGKMVGRVGVEPTTY